MKYLHLVWSSLFRSKMRTTLTLLSVSTAFLLFGMLDSVRVAFNSSAAVGGSDRLLVASKLSITQGLPYSLQSRIAATKGVSGASYATWFGGTYRDPRNFFPNFAIGPGYLDLYPEYVLPAEQRKAFENERSGAIVGEALAKKHGWKIGDTIPLQATIFPTGGSNSWEFKLVGIYKIADAKREGQEKQLMFHWDYFDQANDYIKGEVNWYVVGLVDGKQSAQVAKAIDALSENSSHETKTQTEQAFNQAFFKQLADVGLIVSAIMAAVFFTLLLLTGNTMAQAVRERIPELAVMKTIGFGDRSLLLLVLAESALLALLGGMSGLGLATLVMPAMSKYSMGVVHFPSVPAETWALGLILVMALGLAVGLPPALRAMRLNIVDALAAR